MGPAPRFRGANAGGMARAIVNGSGRLIDLEIDPELLRRPATLVAEAVLSAVLDAQDKAVQSQEAASEVDLAGIQAMAEQANVEVDRKMAQFAALVEDLSRGLESRR